MLWRTYIIHGKPKWLCVVSLVLAAMDTGESDSQQPPCGRKTRWVLTMHMIAIYSALVAFGRPDIGRVVNIAPNLIAMLLVTYKTWYVLSIAGGASSRA